MINFPAPVIWFFVLIIAMGRGKKIASKTVNTK